VDEMPMTITGKVQKFAMRHRMIDKLKLPQPPLADLDLLTGRRLLS
jgi:hypothetical protein